MIEGEPLLSNCVAVCVHEKVAIADSECLLFSPGAEFTDDTVMTIAVCQALLGAKPGDDEAAMKHLLIQHMKKWGRKYPHADCGARFGCI